MKMMVIVIVSIAYLLQICCSKPVVSLNEDVSQSTEKVVSNTRTDKLNDKENQQMSGKDHYYRAYNLMQEVPEPEDPEEVLKEFLLALEKGYDTIDLQIEMGSLLADFLNRHEEAIERFRIAVERDKSDGRAHWRLALSLYAVKQYEEALREFQICELLDPDGRSYGFYKYYKAKSLEGMGRDREALKEYLSYIKHYEDIINLSEEVCEARERIKSIQKKLNLKVLSGNTCCPADQPQPVRPDEVRGWKDIRYENGVHSIAELVVNKDESSDNGRIGVKVVDIYRPHCDQPGGYKGAPTAALRFFRVSDKKILCEVIVTGGKSTRSGCDPSLGISAVIVYTINTRDDWVYFKVIE